MSKQVYRYVVSYQDKRAELEKKYSERAIEYAEAAYEQKAEQIDEALTEAGLPSPKASYVEQVLAFSESTKNKKVGLATRIKRAVAKVLRMESFLTPTERFKNNFIKGLKKFPNEYAYFRYLIRHQRIRRENILYVGGNEYTYTDYFKSGGKRIVVKVSYKNSPDAALVTVLEDYRNFRSNNPNNKETLESAVEVADTTAELNATT